MPDFQYEAQGARLTGLATNLHAKATMPLKVTFEFPNAKGEVVTTQAVDLPVLRPRRITNSS